MKKCVYIHTNAQQWIGALVAAYALHRNSRTPDAFDIEFLHVKDFNFLKAREGQKYLRKGVSCIWRLGDLQSFTPLRFLPPMLMGYEGRAVVTDPDVFAVGDINELLDRDMRGRAVMARYSSHIQGFATSVMLMDCAKLGHWNAEVEFDALFRGESDYRDWIYLRREQQENIGFLEDEWNDFDCLNDKTKMLHNTNKRTQPWKTGLPVDFTTSSERKKQSKPGFLSKLRSKAFGATAAPGNYQPHPDKNQETFFFGLLKECLDQGLVTESLLRDEMRQNHVRHDALEVLERTPYLARQNPESPLTWLIQ